MAESFAVLVGGGSVTVEVDEPPGAGGDWLICAHGAGGNRNDSGVLSLRDTFGARGLSVVRFDFLYKARGSGRPDPMPLLQQTYAAVVDEVRSRFAPRRVFLSGRSMGGRTATMLASAGYACDGVVPIAYPLHPPKQPTKLRVDHLKEITVPVLCFSGTRDEFCTPELMRAAVDALPHWTQHWLEGADHFLHVLKRSGRTDAQVLAEVGDATLGWIASHA